MTKMFISLEALKAPLNITTNEKDAYLKQLIEQASAAIESFIGRSLSFDDYEERMKLSEINSNEITLKITPISEITSITLFKTLLHPPQEGWEYQKSSGIFYLPINIIPPSTSSYEGNNAYNSFLKINYKAGYALPTQPNIEDVPSLPADIQAACLNTSLSLYYMNQRDPSIRSESEAGIGSTNYSAWDTSKSSLPPQAASIMEQYRYMPFC